MFPVPEASVPAREICSDRSQAGITGRKKRDKLDVRDLQQMEHWRMKGNGNMH